MRLDVWSDIACPWCLLGKRRLEKALEGMGPRGKDVEIHWRAFELQPALPTEGAPRSFLEAKLGGPEKLQKAQAHIAGLGKLVGIDYAFEKQERVSNTRLAHRAIALGGALPAEAAAAQTRTALVEAFFRAHFEEGKDISPLATVLDVAARVGVDRAWLERELKGDGGLQEVLEDETMAGELGIGGVPCFVANMKVAVSGAQDVETFQQFLDEAMRG